MEAKERSPKGPNLVETQFSVTIPAEYIDANGHMNNAEYLRVFQDARSAYFLEASGMTMAQAGPKWGLRSFIPDLSMKFMGQLFENDQIDVYTSAEPSKAFINFFQRIIKDGKDVSSLRCRICLVDERGRPVRLPDHVRDIFDKLNLRE